MAMPSFDHTHSKISEMTFSFPKFAPACKKSVHSIYFILVIQPILESCDQAGHIQFWQFPPKKIKLNFSQITSEKIIRTPCNAEVKWVNFTKFLNNIFLLKQLISTILPLLKKFIPCLNNRLSLSYHIPNLCFGFPSHKAKNSINIGQPTTKMCS